MLRFRSDEQLVELFRAGQEDAFRVIHDRYRQRLFAYSRQMLPRRQDAEDALQDVFIRAYAGLRASDRDLALRAWLYRIAHNRCVDELRRRPEPAPERVEVMQRAVDDPVAAADQRESLRRLVADIRRLPDQQRSALLMRELSGMAYGDMAAALGVSVPAVKSLLVRARVALAQASEARDTACSEIREELSSAHDRGVRPAVTAKRHMRDCPGCQEFRKELRGVSRQLAAFGPGLGPIGVLAKLLGVGGGAGGGAAATGSSAAGAGGVLASAGTLATGAGHVATLIAATVVTAGGAVEIQRTISSPSHRTAPAAASRHQAWVAQPDRSSQAQSGRGVPRSADTVATPRRPAVKLSSAPPPTASAPAKPAAADHPSSAPAIGGRAPAGSSSGGTGKTSAQATSGQIALARGTKLATNSLGDGLGATANGQPGDPRATSPNSGSTTAPPSSTGSSGSTGSTGQAPITSPDTPVSSGSSAAPTNGSSTTTS